MTPDSPHISPSRRKKIRRRKITVEEILDLYQWQDGTMDSMLAAYMRMPAARLEEPYPERHYAYAPLWETIHPWCVSRAVELTKALLENPALPLLTLENPDFGRRLAAYVDSLKATPFWEKPPVEPLRPLDLTERQRALLRTLLQVSRGRVSDQGLAQELELLVARLGFVGTSEDKLARQDLRDVISAIYGR